jgi:SNF2 family DNA or RNA helicase
LLHFIDPKNFGSVDVFLEQYGDIKHENVDDLHEIIRPYVLRRVKTDVEKSVPPKEETIIEVELTILQKQFYRALYEKNIQFLHRNAKKPANCPSLNVSGLLYNSSFEFALDLTRTFEPKESLNATTKVVQSPLYDSRCRD